MYGDAVRVGSCLFLVFNLPYQNRERGVNKTTTKKNTLLLLCGLFVLLICTNISVQAANYDFTYEPVGPGEVYDKNGHQIKVQQIKISDRYTFRILVSTNHKNEFTITGSYGTGMIVFANSKEFIYLLNGKPYDSKAEIRRYNWSTKKSTLITKKKADDLAIFNGKYLFYILEKESEFPLYRYSMSTGKTKKILDDVTTIKYGNKKYLVWKEPGDFPTNASIYVMNKNGGDIKKFAKP